MRNLIAIRNDKRFGFRRAVKPVEKPDAAIPAASVAAPPVRLNSVRSFTSAAMLSIASACTAKSVPAAWSFCVMLAALAAESAPVLATFMPK